MLPEKIKKELAEFTTGDYSLAYHNMYQDFYILDNCIDYQNFICERLNYLRTYFFYVHPDKPAPVLSEVVRCVWIATHYLYSYSLACDIQKGIMPRYVAQLKEHHPDYEFSGTLTDINKAAEYLHYAEYLLYSDKERHKKIYRAVQLKTKNITISIWGIAEIFKSLNNAIHNPKVKTFKELMQFILKNAVIDPKNPSNATRLKSLENYGSQASTKDEIELWNAFKHDRKYMKELNAFRNGVKNAVSEKTK